MSITTPDDRISTYNPVVATTTFAAMFPVFDNSDLSVFVDGVERSDFTVSATYINSISNDATVVFSPGIVGEVKVIGTRDPRRISRFLDGAPLPTRDQNTALDVVMASLQELARDVKRAVKVGFGAIGFNVDTTGIADNSVLMYREDKIVVGPTAGDVANAQTNAASAADSAIKAQKWADNPLNQEVIAGRFSAMHWALKALEWAGAGVAGVSSFNGRTGAVNPQAGDYPSKQDATHTAPSKAAVADADEFNVADSDDSFKAKRSTLTELISSIFKTGRAIANAQFVAATFKLLNGSGKAGSFDASALTTDRIMKLPDRDIDLGAGRVYLGSVPLSLAAVDITGIPANAKSVLLIFEDLATSAAAIPYVQLLTSGGAITSGYDAFISVVSTGGTAAGAFTTGVPLNYSLFSATYKGILDFIRNAPGGNRWSARGQVKFSTSGAFVEGDVALSSEVTGVRITSQAGTATLSGSVKVFVEL